jgi:uncharacterized protein (TIGR00266 family)
MEDTIHGTVMPVLEISLDPGESVQSEAGEFSWMSETIQIDTNTGGGMGGKGLMGAIKRVAGGGSLLFNAYTAQGGPGRIAFAAKVPGHIFPIEVGPGQDYLAHRHGFLAGTAGLELSVGLQQSFRGGIFGGEGFILQKIAGTGKAWIELSGEVLTYDLAAGQTMRAHPGHVGLFQSSVSFQVVRVPGLMNRYMGGDGHHFVVLTGPGKIWLQSMPIPILAGVIGEYLGDQRSGGVEAGAAGGAAASVLGGLFGNR